MTTAGTRYFLPALRGFMGDWTYYASLVPLAEVASRVSYADELHPRSSQLSSLLQRVLKHGRAREISEYLLNEKQRLFNALVVAVYGGQPEFHAFDNLRVYGGGMQIEDISTAARESVGFLSFDGTEKLFALDGQHRLAGIRLATKESSALGNESVVVLFVAHKKTEAGSQRTRRLFTILNKRAKAVSKGEIITLDEDDAMAICVRRLVEGHPYFQGARIAYTANNNIPPANRECLTTIGNLYDTLKIIFTRVRSASRKRLSDICYYRPSDETLDELYEFAVTFFATMARHVKPLDEFFSKSTFANVVRKNRGPFGGDLLFRPIGMSIVVKVIAELSKKQDWDRAVKLVSKLPRDISKAPLVGVVWDSARHAMKKPENKRLVQQIYLYCLGQPVNEQALATGYAVALGVPNDAKRFDKDVKPFRERLGE